MMRVHTVLACLAAVALLAATAGAYEVSQSVVGCGATSTAGASYTVLGTVGQPSIGVTGGAYRAEIGFWYGPRWIATGVDDEGEGIPRAFSMVGNYPNPFNPVTTIAFDVPASGGRVTIQVFDVRGRLVTTLVDGHWDPGRQSVAWTGRDSRGRSVASGVYFCRMTAPGYRTTRKMTLLK